MAGLGALLVPAVININRHGDANAGPMSPLRWRTVHLDGRPQQAVCCANGHAAFLDDHEIAADGTVSPSLVCPEDGCDFHEFVKLEGWMP